MNKILNKTSMSILIISLPFITSCGTTGGTLGGLIPLPKITKGFIQDDRYHAKDGSFSVALPHEKGSYEYTYMALKEKYSKEETYVSFGPAAYDRTLYRVDIIKKPTSFNQPFDLGSMKDLLFEQYAKVINATYRCQLKFISQGTRDLNQYRAHVCEFQQSDTTNLDGIERTENIRHLVYLIENEDYLAMISYATPEDGMDFSASREKFIQSFTLSSKSDRK